MSLTKKMTFPVQKAGKAAFSQKVLRDMFGKNDHETSDVSFVDSVVYGDFAVIRPAKPFSAPSENLLKVLAFIRSLENEDVKKNESS